MEGPPEFHHVPVPVFPEKRDSEVIGTMAVAADPAELVTLFFEEQRRSTQSQLSSRQLVLFARGNWVATGRSRFQQKRLVGVGSGVPRVTRP